MNKVRQLINFYFSYTKKVPVEDLYRVHMIYATVALTSLFLFMLLIYAILTPPAHEVEFRIILFLLLLCLFPIYFFLRKQRWNAVVFMMIVPIWVSTSYGAIISGGVYASVTMLYIIPLILAILLLDNRTLIFFIIITVAFLAYLFITEDLGIVAYSLDRTPLFRFMMVVVACVSTSIALVYSKYRLQDAEKRNRTLYLEKEIGKIQNQYSQSIAHDLRTPLSIMKTQTYLIKRRSEQGESVEANLEKINNYIEKLTRMVDDFTNVSELASFTQIDVDQHIRLLEIIESAISATKPLSAEKDIVVTLQKSGDDPVNIPGNHEYLHQMFRHLIQNSIHYGIPGGKVDITLTHSDKHVSIAIADNGIGIPADRQEHIFEMFYRGNEARTMDLYTGSGIGLAITKRIVDLHQGTITVESEVDKGTTFTVLLPA
ncbi:MAG: HAMP domain-containing histidine kinase [Anaerolineae bacterium]|nr:HAMP domain-containing histidine kinase [Anaerolineae bacterium]MCA9895858.1 HAMP domain-containing histidine kinase [Anaerolineae bacterium]MCB9458735.1 HAMP domain-containing histidine kinase [Anaerolineaceae bacterium]